MKCRKYYRCAMPDDICVDAGFFGYRHCINSDLRTARIAGNEDFYGDEDATDRGERGNFVSRGLTNVIEWLNFISGSIFN